MLKIKRTIGDTETEKDILINCITNTEFLSELHRVAKKEYFLTDISKRLWYWISEYYRVYNEAPQQHIQDIYNIEKDKIPEEEAKLIDQVLINLSERWDREEKINVPYKFDTALKYIKKRSLLVHLDKVKSLLELGQVEEAEREQVNFHKVMKVTSSWCSPLDEGFIREIRKKKNEDSLFTFEGALGDIIGPLKRGWCICWLARYSLGKSWQLGEIRNIAMFNRLKVAEFSLEMSDGEVTDRFYRRILSKATQEGNYLIPVFDCFHNMTEECKKKERIGKIRLFDPKNEEKPIPEIKSFKMEDSDSVDLGPKGYKSCDYCRKKKDLCKDYIQETWYERKYREEISDADIIRKAKAIKRMYSDNYKLRCYPKFSANVKDIVNDLDVLEYSENFVPDVIIVDYPGILAVEDDRVVNPEQNLNDTWVALCRLASERKCLVVGAAQVNTPSIHKKLLSMGDNSQSVRSINANCDIILGLNTTTIEQSLGIARINVLKHRHLTFNEKQEVMILQQLELGQVILDSERLEIREEK